MNEPVEISNEAWQPRWWAMVFIVTAAVLMALIVSASWAADSRMTELRWDIDEPLHSTFRLSASSSISSHPQGEVRAVIDAPLQSTNLPLVSGL